MGDVLRVSQASGENLCCRTVLVVPARAILMPGYIKAYSTLESASAKHEYHALAQMAYLQCQDGELTFREATSPLIVEDSVDKLRVEDGMVLCRDLSGIVTVMVFAGQNNKKLLEAAYRYCTRWVRLDI